MKTVVQTVLRMRITINLMMKPVNFKEKILVYRIIMFI